MDQCACLTASCLADMKLKWTIAEQNYQVLHLPEYEITLFSGIYLQF